MQDAEIELALLRQMLHAGNEGLIERAILVLLRLAPNRQQEQ